MKRLLLFSAILLSKISFGQSITGISITPTNNASSACANNAIAVSITTTGTFTNSFVYSLERTEDGYISCFPFGGGSINRESSIVSTSSTSNSVILTIPSSVLEIGQTGGGYTNNGNCFESYTITAYKLKVSTYNNGQIEYEIPYSVISTPNCGAVRSVSLNASVCSGATNTISYFLESTFGANNVFTAELSDNTGSFTSPTLIGSYSSETATSFSVSIPSGLPYSSSYKVRIVASEISAGGSFTSAASTSFPIGLPTPIVYNFGNSFTICEGELLGITPYISDVGWQFNNSEYGSTWKKDGINIDNQNQNSQFTYAYYRRNPVGLSDAGNYSVKITRLSDGCEATSPNQAIIIPAAPSPPTTSPITVISGSTASLTASGCAGNLTWYDAQTGGNSVNSTTSELSQQTTYYAACRQNSGSFCYSTRTPLIVSINPTNAPNAPTLTASDNNFCRGSVQSPKITATGCSGIVRWYRKNIGDISFRLQETDNVSPYEYSFDIYNSYIYAADCRENNVLSTSKSEITISVISIPSSPNILPGYCNLNNGSTITLDAIQCTGTIKWYSDYTSTIILATGNNYTSPVLINNSPNTPVEYNYFASCSVNGCESDRINNTIYVYNEITAPSFSYSENINTVCSGNSKTIQALGCSNGTINWYDNFAGGTLLATGQSYTPTVLTYNNLGNNQYYYYADCTIGAETSLRDDASVSVYRQPTTPSANQPTIACNATATLTSTGCSTSSPEYFEVYWYASATATNYLSNSTTYTTPNLSATTTYYLECSRNICKSPRVPITVTVSCTPPNPPVISSNTTTVCAGTGVNLTATGCANTVNWSDGGVGTSRMNVIFNANITLTSTCNNGLASANSNSISITVNPKPTLVITNPVAVAPPATVDVTLAAVTVGSTLYGATLSYHTDMPGAVSLPNPATIAISNTYYIKATTTASCTDIKPVVVVINDCGSSINLVSTTDNMSMGTHLKKTNETIFATNIISGNANVTYRSNKSITLNPQANGGFKVENGTVFLAEIGGCN